MKNIVLGMLAETCVHTGCGRETGFVDLPVARESTTENPIIYGSSLKGAFRSLMSNSERYDDADIDSIFGEADSAGDLIISDARMLLLPVRSLSGPYKWVTSTYILETLKRDMKRAGDEIDFEIPTGIKPGKALCSKEDDSESLILEEREFEIESTDLNDVVKLIEKFIPHEDVKKRLEKQLVILDEDDFEWFAKYGLAIHARNKLTDEKTSDNLWYEETIVPDTLFYTLVFDRGDSLDDFVSYINKERSYLQVGGNETVGQGWFALKLIDGW